MTATSAGHISHMSGASPKARKRSTSSIQGEGGTRAGSKAFTISVVVRKSSVQRVIIAFRAQDAAMPAVAWLCWGTAREQSQLSSVAWKDIWGHLCDRYCPAGLGIARTYPSAARLPRGSSSAAQGLDGCGENTSAGWVPPAHVLLPAAISIPLPAHTRGSLLLSSLTACDGCPLLRPSWGPAEQ